MIDSISLTILAILGFAIGFVGGLVGLVLGVIRFPLILGSEVSASITAGTNIGVSTLGAMSAAIKHFRQNNFHFRIFIIMAVTGAVGGFLGALLTKFVPMNLLLFIIGSIVSYEAYMMISGLRKKKNQDNHQEQKKENIILESCIGFGVGFLGGLVGLVLGSIRMPAMITVLKIEPKVAIGTNLAAATIMGVSGFLGHLINNEVDFLVLSVMGPTAMIGGYIGAKFTNKFSAERLKLIIGIVLVVVALFMFSRISLYH